MCVVAVARRARQQTIVALREGVRAVVDVLLAWPKAYRARLVDGLVLNDQGQLHPALLSELATLVGSIDRDDWEAIVDVGRTAPWAHALDADAAARTSIGEAMSTLDESLPTGHRHGWTELNRFVALGPDWPFCRGAVVARPGFSTGLLRPFGVDHDHPRDVVLADVDR